MKNTISTGKIIKKNIAFPKNLTLFFVLGLFIAVSSCIALATVSETNISSSRDYTTRSLYADIQIEQLRYEPYPVNPGEYFDIAIKAENLGGGVTNNLVFELIPKYPFSLESGEDAFKDYGRLDSLEPVILEYRLRVDKNAVEGENEIKLRYTPDGNTDSPAWSYETFKIKIENVQTDFDVVLQESSGNEVSLAIANIGKNTANSVIAKIPEQEYFEAAETSGQMVGNLENGDYTLVSFKINPKMSRPEKSAAKSGSGKTDAGSRGKKILKLQVDYTDTIGERRTVVKEIPFELGITAGIMQAGGSVPSASAQATGGFQGRKTAAQPETKLYQRFWVWLIILGVFIAVWKLYRMLRKRKEEQEEKKHRTKA